MIFEVGYTNGQTRLCEAPSAEEAIKQTQDWLSSLGLTATVAWCVEDEAETPQEEPTMNLITYTHGTPIRRSLCWQRIDTQHGGQEDGYRLSVFTAGPHDDSPRWPHWEHGKYNPDCSCCYLGHSHTEEAHRQRITRTEEN